ncbi:hypothetical protein GC163_16385 [bacterium]|nr:hypothetical protein [bacterium]
MSLRALCPWMLCGLLAFTVGCQTFNKSANWDGSPPKQSEPDLEDEEPDKWASVGKEGRGNRALEDENDPLKPLLMSKKARDIERNLGYK